MPRERIALALMGMDQHENGVMAVSRILREAQMQVSYLGKFQTPEGLARRAVEQGSHAVGVSCHSWEYLSLAPRLVEELRMLGSRIPVVIGGSVITTQDADRMRAAGVAAVFPAGARDTEIVDTIRQLIVDSEDDAVREF